jgi:hypothetical protein
MYEPRSGGKTPLIAVGFSEGLVAPIVELVISALATAVSAVSSATGSPNLMWFFVVFATMDLLRNVVGCLLHTQYAIGHVAGSLIGIVICYSSISLINSEIANSSLTTTIILTLCLTVGVVIALLRWVYSNRNSSTEFSY